MSRFALILVALCLFGLASPARALGTLKFCDNIPNPGERMACLQAHISNLEETLLTLNNRIVTLEKALEGKLDADSVYKLQHVGIGACLGVASGDAGLKIVSCDQPDSWKLLTGSQRPKKAKSDDDKDKDKDKDKKDKKSKKDKAEGKDKAKKSESSEQSKSAPAAPAQ